MLLVSEIHTHYGLSHILQGISLEVHAGEVVALVGRNGVGKTTTLQSIAGWVPLSAGTITLAGQSIAGLPADKICRAGISIVPEDRRIFPRLTVLENLRLGLMQTPGRSRANKKEAIGRVLKQFPRLAERRSQAGTTLSGGEQQMLAIARVLVGEPRLILIDEPTEGLAPMIVEELFQAIADIRDQGIAAILVEQNVMRAFDLADRAYAIERGTVIAHGNPKHEADRAALLGAISL